MSRMQAISPRIAAMDLPLDSRWSTEIKSIESGNIANAAAIYPARLGCNGEGGLKNTQKFSIHEKHS